MYETKSGIKNPSVGFTEGETGAKSRAVKTQILTALFLMRKKPDFLGLMYLFGTCKSANGVLLCLKDCGFFCAASYKSYSVFFFLTDQPQPLHLPDVLHPGGDQVDPRG